MSNWIKYRRKGHAEMRDLTDIEKLKKSFPEFAKPQYRKCELYIPATEDDSGIVHVDTPFQFVTDGENVYGTSKTDCVVFYKNGVASHINPDKAKEILDYLKETK